MNKKKPKAKLLGADGNVFNLLGICKKALKKAGQAEEAKELTKRVFSSGDYHEALTIMLEYVDAGI